MSIEHDLRTSRDFAELYLTEYPKIGSPRGLVEALMVAMIIGYARSFGGGVRRSKLPKPDNVLTKEQIACHEFYLALRDKYIAHSINAYEECQLVARFWDHTVQADGINDEKEKFLTLIRKEPFEKLLQGSPGPKTLDLSKPLRRRRPFT